MTHEEWTQSTHGSQWFFVDDTGDMTWLITTSEEMKQDRRDWQEIIDAFWRMRPECKNPYEEQDAQE